MQSIKTEDNFKDAIVQSPSCFKKFVSLTAKIAETASPMKKKTIATNTYSHLLVKACLSLLVQIHEDLATNYAVIHHLHSPLQFCSVHLDNS